jgi:hypothetical protein
VDLMDAEIAGQKFGIDALLNAPYLDETVAEGLAPRLQALAGQRGPFPNVSCEKLGICVGRNNEPLLFKVPGLLPKDIFEAL